MSIYIGNDLEDRLEALETENASLRKYNEYHQVVNEIDHMSDLHVDSSFYKQSMDIDKYFRIKKWHDSSIGQSTVIQQLNDKRPKLSNQNQTQNRRRYVKGKVHPKNMLVSDVRSDKIGKNAVDRFSLSHITSGSQDICIQSGGTSDMEAAILICK